MSDSPLLPFRRASSRESRTGGSAPSAPENPRRARAIRAIAIASRLFEPACQSQGLSLPQYRLLLWIRHGPRRAAELAERISVKRPTVTALVDGLAEQGWLRRERVAGDRRGIELVLTERGLSALDAVEDALGGLLEGIADHGNRELVFAGLDDLASSLETELEARGTLRRR